VARKSGGWAPFAAPFLEHALAIEWQHGDLTLRGWVADPNATSAALAEIQYCYVNGRMMRDRLINHAIRQACEDKLGPISSRLCAVSGDRPASGGCERPSGQA
jgi:DNA mismatch repair ATPase MutL